MYIKNSGSQPYFFSLQTFLDAATWGEGMLLASSQGHHSNILQGAERPPTQKVSWPQLLWRELSLQPPADFLQPLSQTHSIQETHTNHPDHPGDQPLPKAQSPCVTANSGSQLTPESQRKAPGGSVLRNLKSSRGTLLPR